MLQYENIWVDAFHPLCQALILIMNTLKAPRCSALDDPYRKAFDSLGLRSFNCHSRASSAPPLLGTMLASFNHGSKAETPGGLGRQKSQPVLALRAEPTSLQLHDSSRRPRHIQEHGRSSLGPNITGPPRPVEV